MSTSISPLLHHCLAQAGLQAQRAQATLMPPQADPGMRVQADEALLAQALERLQQHAMVRFGAGAELTLRAIRQGGRACLGVQVRGGGSGGGGAADMGSPALEEAHHLVQRLGGSLGAGSAARGASSFHFWLPLASNDPFHPEPGAERQPWHFRSHQALQPG